MMWYRSSLDEIFKHFTTNAEDGLSKISAEDRIKKYGKNVLPRGKKITWLQFLLRQFKSPLIYILLVGAALTAYLNEWTDMTVILLAVIVNVAVGFWQEFRSNNILEKLKEIVKTNALVIRDGEVHEIDSELLVPGDIILLKAGKKVPADARIVSSNRLKLDEASLTGESSPVGKENVEITEEKVIGDRNNMVHMGTLVARGDGVAVVVATGSETEFGKIALLTQRAEDDPTPLQIRMGKLGRVIAVLVGIATLIIFFVGMYEGESFREMFTTAIAVAVAAIPEGLPAAISIVLAVGAQKILKQKGVIKRLVAAEALGSASVICTDKTGTLTEGKMVIKKMVIGGDEELARENLALANEGLVERCDGKFVVNGETTDQAKLRYFLDNGGHHDALMKRMPRISLLTFNPELKYIASFHKDSNTKKYKLFTNGAPEEVLSLSSKYIAENGETAPLTDEIIDAFKVSYEELASQGYRVLGLSERVFDSVDNADSVDLEDIDTRNALAKDMVFIGFAAIRDPIRDDVRVSIIQARSAGVKTIMMTGDHILTAKAIGGELGFDISDDAVMNGKDIGSCSDEQLQEKVKVVEIFARVNPEHKMRIIDALQVNGHVVAMTGDGVNDAPALKSADIGIAVGSGTDIAKAASDLILLNDSFSIIVAAIKQGRIAFDNIRKVTVFLLAGSFTELILIMSSLVLRIPLPITAVQILWTNLVEDSLPNVALAFEPGEKDVMKRPPVGKNESVLDAESKIIIFFVGIFTDFVLLGTFLYFYYLTEIPLDHLRTLIFAALGLDTFFYIYSIKNLRKLIFSYNIFSNKYLLGATFIGVGLMVSAVYTPFLNNLLGTVPLTVNDWLIILAIGIINIVGVEAAKWWFFIRKRGDNGVVKKAA